MLTQTREHKTVVSYVNTFWCGLLLRTREIGESVNSWISIHINKKQINVFIHVYKHACTCMNIHVCIPSSDPSVGLPGSIDTPMAMKTPSTQILASKYHSTKRNHFSTIKIQTESHELDPMSFTTINVVKDIYLDKWQTWSLEFWKVKSFPGGSFPRLRASQVAQ